MQRWYLPSTRAGERVIEWLDDENEPVRRQYGEIVNNSGVASAAEVPKQRGATEQWVYNRMKSNPPEKVGEDDYVRHGPMLSAWTRSPSPPISRPLSDVARFRCRKRPGSTRSTNLPSDATTRT